jgi:CRISPR-associated protein Csm3
MPASLTQTPLLGKFRFESTLKVVTGLHIGGGGETLDIGGLDKPVIRDPITNYPYLPGSSLKGKLRSTLERLLNKPLNRPGGSNTYRYESDDLEDGYTEVEGQDIPYEGSRTCPLSRLFGATGGSGGRTKTWIRSDIVKAQGLDNLGTKKIKGIDHTSTRGRNTPSRVIVRDCHLLATSAVKLETIDTGLYMTEWKFENGLDRITAAANPRQLERVPAGAEFQFELIYTVENLTQAKEDLRNLAIALRILEDDALGGHGSRGYGKIRFQHFNLGYQDYSAFSSNKSPEPSSPITLENTDLLLSKFGTIEQLLPGE